METPVTKRLPGAPSTMVASSSNNSANWYTVSLETGRFFSKCEHAKASAARNTAGPSSSKVGKTLVTTRTARLVTCGCTTSSIKGLQADDSGLKWASPEGRRHGLHGRWLTSASLGVTSPATGESSCHSGLYVGHSCREWSPSQNMHV